MYTIKVWLAIDVKPQRIIVKPYTVDVCSDHAMHTYNPIISHNIGAWKLPDHIFDP